VATVIVLNGASSSGKTTVARAFQELAPRLFLNFSIDSILYALPLSAQERIARSEDIADLRIRELVRAFYACVGKLLDLGHDLVIDHAVTARYHAELLVAAAGAHEVLIASVDCPEQTLRQREAARGDRRLGMASQQQRGIHLWLDHDIQIDTSRMAPEESARVVVEALTGGPHGAIERTRARLSATDAV